MEHCFDLKAGVFLYLALLALDYFFCKDYWLICTDICPKCEIIFQTFFKRF